jgi:hypothetical protein
MKVIEDLNRAIMRFSGRASRWLVRPGEPPPNPNDFESLHVERDDIVREAIKVLSWAFGLAADREHVEAAYRRLSTWVPEGYDIPFLSEEYLYELLGKEDARTLLALVSNLVNAAGMPPGMQREISLEPKEKV